MSKREVKPDVARHTFDRREMDAYDLLHIAADGGGSICLDEYQAQFVLALIENAELARLIDRAYLKWLDGEYVCPEYQTNDDNAGPR